jgi:hypothetical protein
MSTRLVVDAVPARFRAAMLDVDASCVVGPPGKRGFPQTLQR